MGKKEDHNCIKIEKGIKNNAGYEINLLFLTPPPVFGRANDNKLLHH